MENANTNVIAEEVESAEASTAKTGNIPTADKDLVDLCKTVSKKWKATPALTLLWTTSAKFETQTIGFDTAFVERKTAGGKRPNITQQMKSLDAKIEKSISHVKNYISEKNDKEDAVSFYPQFGIIKKKNAYVLPDDRNKRSGALEMMIKAIAANGFNSKIYGKTYWETIKTKYDALIGSASSTDGTISDQVGVKNELKIELDKTLSSIIKLIEANFPDTDKAELRNWGFQKEKY